MEVAFFDVSPVCQNADINDGWLGSWSAYPFFPSGNIAVQSIEGGLFMLNVSQTVLFKRYTIDDHYLSKA